MGIREKLGTGLLLATTILPAVGATSCGRVERDQGQYASAVEQALQGKQQAERQRNYALLLDLVLAIGLVLSLLSKKGQRQPQVPGTVNAGAIVTDAQALITTLRTQLSAFETNIAAAGGLSGVPALIIPVQPTLGNMMRDIDGQIIRLSAAFQNEPHLVAPIIRRFDDMKLAINRGDMRTAIQVGYMVQGAIHYLATASANATAAPQDRDSLWKEFVRTRQVPQEWLNVQDGRLLNFFRIFGVTETDTWSSEFEREVTTAYRKIAREGHPDALQHATGIDPSERKRRQDLYEFVMRTRANEVLTSRASFGQYVDARRFYQSLPK